MDELTIATRQAATAERELQVATAQVQRAARRFKRHLQDLALETMQAENAQARILAVPAARVPRGRAR